MRSRTRAFQAAHRRPTSARKTSVAPARTAPAGRVQSYSSERPISDSTQASHGPFLLDVTGSVLSRR